MAPPLFLLRLPIATAILLLFLSASTATARPCRTFLISSYTLRNPSSNTFTTITEIRSLTPRYTLPNDHDNKPYEIFFDRLHPIHEQSLEEIDHARASRPRAPLGFSATSYDFTSLRDRTKDILSVVLALLFGVGCGALTAATMYLVWSVFSARREYRYYDDFSSSDDGEIESPKKMGYVKIPAAEEAAAAAPAPPPPPPQAKESSV